MGDVYRLEPIPDTEGHRSWDRSTVCEPVWVRANSPREARDCITRSEIAKAVEKRVVAEKMPGSPWNDETITTCVLDAKPPITVSDGVVVTKRGNTYVVF